MKVIILTISTICYIHVYAQKDYALFFAANEYEHFDDLTNPIKNARDLAKVLIERYDFQVEIVENPNRSMVRQKLIDYSNDFKNGHKNNDGQLFLFFSGHGDYSEEFNNGYWVPVDGKSEDLSASAILYSEWRPFINNINCKHILVAIDACYSGTFDPFIAGMRGKDFSRPNSLDKKEQILKDHKSLKTRLFMASGAKIKTPDRSDFAKQLLGGLRLGASRFGLLSIHEINVLHIQNARPKPVFSAFGDDEAGSNFLFVETKVDINTDRIKANEKDLNAWIEAENKNTVQSFRKYIDSFPSGRFLGIARAKIDSLDEFLWERIKSENTIETFEEYLIIFPQGKYSNQVRLKIQLIGEKTEWEITKKLDTKESYLAYLKIYPDGKYADEAKTMLKKIGDLKREKSAWEYANKIQSIKNFEDFINKYPHSKKALIAKQKIQSLIEESAWKDTKYKDTQEAYLNYLISYPNGKFVQLAKSKIITIKNQYGVVKDSDGNQYSYKTMEDGKTWMTQNLNFKTRGGYCYNNDVINCEKHGRLYNWNTANEVCRELGYGWRLPNNGDWKNLINLYGGIEKNFNNSLGKTPYNNLISGGNSEFAAQLSGFGNLAKFYEGLNASGYYWSSSSHDSSNSSYFFFSEGELWSNYSLKSNRFSVRCIKGKNE